MRTWVRGMSAAAVLLAMTRAAAAEQEGHVPAQTRGPSSHDVQLAQSLFDEGRRLMEASRYVEACPKLDESQRLDPGGGTLLNLALCREREGRLATSQVLFDEALRVADRDGRKDRRTIAEEHLQSLAKRQAKLMVRVRDVPPGVRVRLDGVELREPAWGVAANIDPGLHRIEGDAPNREAFSQVVDVFEGEITTVDVRLRTRTPAPHVPVVAKVTNPAVAPLVVLAGASLSTAVIGGLVAATSSDGDADTATAAMAVGLLVGIPTLVVAFSLPKKEIVVSASLGGASLSGRF